MRCSKAQRVAVVALLRRTRARRPGARRASAGGRSAATSSVASAVRTTRTCRPARCPRSRRRWPSPRGDETCTGA
jgi:hypothetical protein